MAKILPKLHTTDCTVPGSSYILNASCTPAIVIVLVSTELATETDLL